MFATQNPIEFEGTYPLPEAQLDRFLMKIRIRIRVAERTNILERPEGFEPRRRSILGLRRSTPRSSKGAPGSTRKFAVEPALFDLHRPIVRKTRECAGQ